MRASVRGCVLLSVLLGCTQAPEQDFAEMVQTSIKTAPLPGQIVDVDAHDLIGFIARTASANDTAKLDVLNLTSTVGPWLTSRLSLPGYRPARVKSVASMVYVLASDSVGKSHVLVADVSAPAAPFLAGDIGLPSAANDLAVADGRVYVSTHSGTLVYAINVPANPTLLETIASGDTWGIVAAPGRFYASTVDTPSTILVYDATGPSGRLLYATPTEGGSATARTRLFERNGMVLTAGSLLDAANATANAPGVAMSMLSNPDTAGAIDAEGGDVAAVSAGPVLHRYSFGIGGQYFERSSQTLPPLEGSTRISHLGLTKTRALVARQFEYTVVPLATGECNLVGVPLRVTYDSTPTAGHPNRTPWTADEIDYLDRALGLERTAGGATLCVKDGLIDRITRYTGPPDTDVLPDGFNGFYVNVVKDPSTPVASFTRNGGARLTFAGAPGIISLAHELTHALLSKSYPSSSLLLTEGSAVAMELAMAEDLHSWGALDAAEVTNSPGISMDSGTAYNPSLKAMRYHASGFFLFRQVRASTTPYLARLRSLVAQVAVPPGTTGAALYSGAIRAAAPSCVADQDRDAWLASQHIFAMTPEDPAMEIFTFAPYIERVTFHGNLIPFRRTLSPGPQEETPNLSVSPTSLALADNSLFFGATLFGGWSLFDTAGTAVGATNRPLAYQTELRWVPFLVEPGLASTSTDDEAELLPCSTDADGDGERHCRSSRQATLTVSWTDPNTGAPRSLSRTQTSYHLRGWGWQGYEPIVGVTTSLVSGTLRITLPLLDVAFDATIEGGTFRVPQLQATTETVQTMYSLAPAEPPCRVLAPTRPLCPLTVPAPGCPVATPVSVSRDAIVNYRGPVRVERMSATLGTMFGAKTFYKSDASLKIVY